MHPYNVILVQDPDQVDPYVLYNLFVEAIRESAYSGRIPIDEEQLKGTALHYSSGDISNTCLVLLVHEKDGVVGFLCGEVAYMTRYFQKEPIASETLWWIRKDHRGKAGRSSRDMVSLFEEWGKMVGCSFATMSNQANECMEKVSNFYVSNGYVKLEESFLKGIV